MLLIAFAAGIAKPTEIGIKPLWELYDYDYEPDGYGERMTCLDMVEIHSDLGNGISGWQYIGVIRTEETISYNSDDHSVVIFWANRHGHSGEAASRAAALRGIMAGKPYIVRD